MISKVSGSHRCVELLAAGYDLVVDNLSNASVESLRRVSEISGVGLEFTLPLTPSHQGRGNSDVRSHQGRGG